MLGIFLWRFSIIGLIALFTLGSSPVAMSQEISSDLDLTVVTADRVPETKRQVTRDR
jgi:adenylate cyclase